MKYKDLNLKAIRDEYELDFAHFTYQNGMCSCCYGPRDLPDRYWAKGSNKESNDISFILFKNANNGSGVVTRNDELREIQYIEWSLPADKLKPVCQALQNQLGNEYSVGVPSSERLCIMFMRIKPDTEFDKDYEWLSAE